MSVGGMGFSMSLNKFKLYAVEDPYASGNNIKDTLRTREERCNEDAQPDVSALNQLNEHCCISCGQACDHYQLMCNLKNCHSVHHDS